jgi:predicted CXXCH cytochrome family protein
MALAPQAIADPQRAFEDDVHAAAGLTCRACHAGGGWERAGRPVAPARTEIARRCAVCHGEAAYMRQFDPQVRIDQFSQYLTSGHGKRMAAGDERAATCSDCHGAHGIVRVKDPRSPVAPLNAAGTCARCHADADRMAAYGRDAAPFADWSASVHAAALLTRGDTSAPTCHTCHGSHGATPPGVAEVVNVCAQCHVREADLFRASPKKAIFDGIGQPECLACHSNHRIEAPTDAQVGLAEGSLCGGCHDAGSDSARTILAVRSGLDDLMRRTADAGEVIGRAERAGMLVDEGRAALRRAHENQIHARVLVHAFAARPFEEVLAPAADAATQARGIGESALQELDRRRRGLAVATIFILGFLGTLWWKIRRLGPAE